MAIFQVTTDSNGTITKIERVEEKTIRERGTEAYKDFKQALDFAALESLKLRYVFVDLQAVRTHILLSDRYTAEQRTEFLAALQGFGIGDTLRIREQGNIFQVTVAALKTLPPIVIVFRDP